MLQLAKLYQHLGFVFVFGFGFVFTLGTKVIHMSIAEQNFLLLLLTRRHLVGFPSFLFN